MLGRPGTVGRFRQEIRALARLDHPHIVRAHDADRAHAGVPWGKVFSSPTLWALCLMYGFVGFSGNFITNWLPSYLKHHRSLTDEETAWLSALPLAFGICSCVLGGVLSDWIVALAEAQGWHAQSTSVPGVAHRTGATIYYIEMLPPKTGRAPILSLMPAQGDPQQQKMMMYMMPGIFTVMMLFLPAGIGVYMVTNSVLAIGQQLLVERYLKRGGSSAAAP